VAHKAQAIPIFLFMISTACKQSYSFCILHFAFSQEEKRLAKEEERLAKLHAKEEKKRGKKEAKELLLANDGNSKK